MRAILLLCFLFLFTSVKSQMPAMKLPDSLYTFQLRIERLPVSPSCYVQIAWEVEVISSDYWDKSLKKIALIPETFLPAVHQIGKIVNAVVSVSQSPPSEFGGTTGHRQMFNCHFIYENPATESRLTQYRKSINILAKKKN